MKTIRHKVVNVRNPATLKFEKLGALRGESAYEAAVAEGFKGTKAEWIDAFGKSTPSIKDGYWYIDGVNTNIRAVGLDGADGADGADGYTPVKGADYWTPSDKSEIVSDVLAALPNANGVSF